MTVALPHLVGSATFSYTALQASSLRFCISTALGLFVYDIKCNVEEGLFLFCLACHELPEESELELGVTGNSIFWIQGGDNDCVYSVSFTTTKIADCNTLQLKIFRWCENDITALYSLSVFEYAEARGVLVMGNAFGELSILDFSGSDPHHLANCLLKPIEPTPYNKQVLLPRVSTVIASRYRCWLDYYSTKLHLILMPPFLVSVSQNRSGPTHGNIGIAYDLQWSLTYGE